jgi:CRP-like cAMP-binding protein
MIKLDLTSKTLKPEIFILKLLERNLLNGGEYYQKKNEVMAKKLGYCRESINRALKSLERQGFIRQEGEGTQTKKIYLILK